MKSVSIGAAWLEASAFVKRESALLLPVALLFLAIPLILVFQSIPPELREGAAEASRAEPQLSGMAALLILVCSVVMIGGTLALYALSLKPGISVGEALRLALVRMPVSLGATLLMGMAIGVPAAALSTVSLPLGSLLMVAAAFFVSARLLMLNPLIVDRPVGMIAALQLGWRMTRGQVGRLLVYVIAISLPIMLTETVAQVMLGLIGYALGGAALGTAFSDVGSAVVLALGQMLMIAMTSSLYRQLARMSD